MHSFVLNPDLLVVNKDNVVVVVVVVIAVALLTLLTLLTFVDVVDVVVCSSRTCGSPC